MSHSEPASSLTPGFPVMPPRITASNGPALLLTYWKLSRVAGDHCWPPAPSEPDTKVTLHPAQALDL